MVSKLQWNIDYKIEYTLKQIIMRQPILKYLPASSRCIQQVTPQYRTRRGCRASAECFSEAEQEDRAIKDVS